MANGDPLTQENVFGPGYDYFNFANQQRRLALSQQLAQLNPTAPNPGFVPTDPNTPQGMGGTNIAGAMNPPASTGISGMGGGGQPTAQPMDKVNVGSAGTIMGGPPGQLRGPGPGVRPQLLAAAAPPPPLTDSKGSPFGPVLTPAPAPTPPAPPPAAAPAPATYTSHNLPDSIKQITAEAAKKQGVSQSLINAVIARESNGDPTAVSPRGAIGLMQLEPSTAADLPRGAGRGYSEVELRDPATNIEAGTRYLKTQLANFQTMEEALAAYNWGPGNVLHAVKNRQPFPPTVQAYVNAVMQDAGAGIDTAAQNKMSADTGLVPSTAAAQGPSAAPPLQTMPAQGPINAPPSGSAPAAAPGPPPPAQGWETPTAAPAPAPAPAPPAAPAPPPGSDTSTTTIQPGAIGQGPLGQAAPSMLPESPEQAQIRQLLGRIDPTQFGQMPPMAKGVPGVLQRIGYALLSATKLAPAANQIMHPKWSMQQEAYGRQLAAAEALEKGYGDISRIGLTEQQAREVQLRNEELERQLAGWKMLQTELQGGGAAPTAPAAPSILPAPGGTAPGAPPVGAPPTPAVAVPPTPGPAPTGPAPPTAPALAVTAPAVTAPAPMQQPQANRTLEALQRLEDTGRIDPLTAFSMRSQFLGQAKTMAETQKDIATAVGETAKTSLLNRALQAQQQGGDPIEPIFPARLNQGTHDSLLAEFREAPTVEGMQTVLTKATDAAAEYQKAGSEFLTRQKSHEAAATALAVKTATLPIEQKLERDRADYENSLRQGDTARTKYLESSIDYGTTLAASQTIEQIVKLARENPIAGQRLRDIIPQFANAMQDIKRAGAEQGRSTTSSWDGFVNELASAAPWKGKPLTDDTLDQIMPFVRTVTDGAVKRHNATVRALNTTYPKVSFAPEPLPYPDTANRPTGQQAGPATPPPTAQIRPDRIYNPQTKESARWDQKTGQYINEQTGQPVQ